MGINPIPEDLPPMTYHLQKGPPPNAIMLGIKDSNMWILEIYKHSDHSTFQNTKGYNPSDQTQWKRGEKPIRSFKMQKQARK